MKKTVEIENNPEIVRELLISFKKDNHLSRTFEGSIKNGSITGFYTNLALVNGVVIGYVKIKGQYNLEKGNLKLEVLPGNLFWIVIIFDLVATAILTYKAMAEDKLILIGSILFFLMALVIALAFLLESKSFVRQMKKKINSKM